MLEVILVDLGDDMTIFLKGLSEGLRILEYSEWYDQELE
jgi:hypothetical protein